MKATRVLYEYDVLHELHEYDILDRKEEIYHRTLHTCRLNVCYNEFGEGAEVPYIFTCFFDI